MSKFAGIKEGDVVKIKFKPMTEITKDMKMTKKLSYLSEYDIGNNVNALILSGDFVVVCAEDAMQPKNPSVEIDNHHDGGTFTVYEHLIDTIEVIEVANKFVSEDHGIIMIQIEDKLYINGELLSNTTEYSFNGDEVTEQLDKFTAFMEKFLVAKAFEGSLNGDDEKTDDA